MKILLKQVKAIGTGTQHDGHLIDILVNDGRIDEIGADIQSDADIIVQSHNLHISFGWVEILADLGDPGYEYRETISSGTAAAVAGGFTDVMVMPNVKPVNSTKGQTEYIRQKGEQTPVTLHPIGAVSKNAEGKELAEMYDMLQSGAVAFSDGTQSVLNESLLIKALQYHLPTGKTIIQIPAANRFSAKALVNEGIPSTRLGLPGMPAVAEELMIAKDIALAQYTGGKLHISGVSTAAGLQLILDAKIKNIPVSCSVTPQHLWFTDEVLETYDSNFKLHPPLRTETDRVFLQQAAKDGLIDCFTSQHLPRHTDEKDCEFEYAEFGNIGLETLFSSLLTAGIPLPVIIEKLSVEARKVFALPIPELGVGAEACFTLFNPEAEYTYHSKKGQSLSSNSAFDGRALTGVVHGIVHKGKLTLNPSL